jgi:hypothetical protein
MNADNSINLIPTLISVFGIFVFVNFRAYLYYKYLMLQKGSSALSFTDFLFSNKNLFQKLQLSLPFPILIKNSNQELETLRKRINKQTLLSYVCIALLLVIRFFFIESQHVSPKLYFHFSHKYVCLSKHYYL